MPTLVQLWRTSDGSTFDTEAAAKEHERCQDLANYMRTFPGDPLAKHAPEFAKFLLRNFEIVRKPRVRTDRPSDLGGTPPVAGQN